jgi:acyl-phosphate glycerol 3-phosphate acyltransferase
MCERDGMPIQEQVLVLQEQALVLTEWIAALELSVLARVIMVAWVVTMISVPIVRRVWGEKGLQAGVTAGVLLQAATVIAIVSPGWGPVATVRTMVIVFVMAWVVELVGSRTGFPFGRYFYTKKLQPQLGRVPLLIPVAWLMMLPPAWAVATTVAGATRGVSFVLAGALAFTVWDLFLDPQMVNWRLWIWSDANQGPRYFGIPWTNFAGWLGASAFITWVAMGAPLVAALPIAPLLVVYGLTWALESFGQLVFWRLTGPAISGFIGMGLCLLWALSPIRVGEVLQNVLPILLWTILAFLSGAIPFSLLLGKLALKTDIRRYGDGNPGATNVLRAGGKGLGLLAAFLDMFKAALPVALAYVVMELRGFEIVPVALAPIAGHCFSPFLQGRGGKGVAVTGGIWIGLTYGVAAAIGTAAMSLGYVVQRNPGWAVGFGLLTIGVYLLVLRPDPALIAVWVGNVLLVMWQHRKDLREPPVWRFGKDSEQDEPAR